MLNTRFLFQRGVSIIEAMIVVALIAILLILALPAGNEWLANSRIRTAGEGLLSGLQLARAEAVRRNAVVELDITGGNSAGWTIRAGNEVVQSRGAGEGTGNVVVVTSPGGATKVSFDGLGRRTANADGSAAINRIAIDLPASVLPADRTTNLELRIGVGGQVLICLPDVEGRLQAQDVRKCPN